MPGELYAKVDILGEAEALQYKDADGKSMHSSDRVAQMGRVVGGSWLSPEAMNAYEVENRRHLLVEDDAESQRDLGRRTGITGQEVTGLIDRTDRTIASLAT